MRSGLSLGSLSALMAILPALGACGAGNDGDGSLSTDTALEEAAAAGACTGKLTVASVAASGADAATPASQAIDGDLTTRWSNNGVGSTITADLGASKPVCGVSVAWYLGTTRTANFSVGVSNDGTTFTHVLDGTSSGTTDALQPVTFAAVNARYVRVTANGNSINDWASVDELAVNGATGFAHPGVLYNQTQLTNVKNKIAAGAQPWKRAYDELASSKYVRSTYVPAPRATIECGPSSGPDNGCTQESDDAHAALANALVWAYTGNTTAADTSIHILNLYAATVKAHTLSNAPLQAGWAAERFTRAAEIMRHTSTRWAAADVAKFQAFLRSQYLPLVQNGWPYGNGNWDTTMIDATIEIAVFSDDRATFDSAIALWKQRVPAYIYISADGALPVPPTRGTSQYKPEPALLTLWEWPTISGGAKPAFPFPNGVAQETCRDFNHVSMGLTSMFDTAETAHVQGVDLWSYSDTAARITSTIEFHSKYLNGATLPDSLCGGELAHRGNGSNPTVGFLSKSPTSVALNYAVPYNHYVNRLGMNLPETRAALATIDANGSDYRNKVGPTASWENLTNIEK